MIKRPIDWLDKLRSLLQTVAFCLAIAAIIFSVEPAGTPYEVPLTYSLCIGLCTWALIDLGRHLPPSAAETGWPRGAAGVVLPVFGVIAGAVTGTLAADQWFGLSSFAHTAGMQWTLVMGFTAIPGTVATYYFYSRSKGLYLEKRIEEVGRQASESRLRLLETQLEPHMLFNTLANLRTLIAIDPARAQTMLDHLIAYLRATLSASRAGTHTLEQEFERLRDYLELMAVRMGPRLQFTLDLPAALAAQTIPPLLLQPLVENSIQHGLEPKVQGGSITVSARLEGGRVCLEVCDTGLGLGPATPGSDGKGFGVGQVRERLATVYGAAGTIDFVAVQEGGTRATVSFPLKS